MSERIIRVRDLCERLGISRTTLWRRVESGALPAPFKIGGPGTRAVGWLESEVDETIRRWSASVQRDKVAVP